MVGKYVIIGGLFLLAGCAQVGQISGGPEDRAAPKPIAEAMVPAQASTNYTGNSIVVPFDEYFTLDKPSQTIVMVPPHAKVNAEVKKKTLTLSWEESLEPNTTYAIYLNGTVRDVNERNDTTLQFVFSTGDQIDSLSYTVPVMDAFSQQPLSDITVALYEQGNNKLISLAKSNEGVAKLNYLRAGTYDLVAFEDENGDLEIQEQERIGFPGGGQITIDSNYFDSIPLRIYTPRLTPRIDEITQKAPCTYEVTFTEDVYPHPTLYVNNTKIDLLSYQLLDSKTMRFPYDIGDEKSFEFIAYLDTVGLIPEDPILINDTTTFRMKPLKDSSLRITDVSGGRELDGSTDYSFIYFELNSFLERGSLDTSKVRLMHTEDSTVYSPLDYSEILMDGAIAFPYECVGSYEITFEKGAFTSTCGVPSKALKKAIKLTSPKDFGTLNLNLSAYDSPVYVEIMEGKEVFEVRSLLDESGHVELTLPPGEYWFRVILDDNKNDLWDPGNYATLTQPERVNIYSKKTKVRANWTVDVSLTPSKSP